MSVLVLGDIMLDKYIDGSVNRISPEAPVPVVHVKNTYAVAGGCGNVAKGVAAQNVPITIIAAIGNDADGKNLQTLLQEKYLTEKLLKHAKPTIAKVRVVSKKHQLLRYEIEDTTAISKQTEAAVVKTMAASKASVIVISDYGKGFCTGAICAAATKYGIQHKVKVLVDPKTHDWSKYANAYLISPNFKEFCEVLGKEVANTEKVIEFEGRELIKKYNLQYLLVTRSEKGMSLISKNNALHLPTIAKDVYDVTGAGDTVIATIAAQLAKKKNIQDAVKMSNLAAAISVAHFGTYTVTALDIKKRK
jgi:D-beta-D-heptose 7-phosphate kinase/D-beta-D-heptose 1-phosphate adenosyltransferase